MSTKKKSAPKPAKKAAKPAAAQSAKKQPKKRPAKKAAAQKAEDKQAEAGQPGKEQAERKQPNGGGNISVKDIYGLKPAAAPEAEEFKATPVELPGKMHVGAEEDPFTADLGGGVSLNPIPRTSDD